MLILKLFSLRDKTFKGIIYGPSSSDIQTSNEVLVKHNFMTSRTYDMPLTTVDFDNKTHDYNDVSFAHNVTILSTLFSTEIDVWPKINPDLIKLYMMDPSIGRNTKKRVLMCLIHHGYVDDIESWTESTSSILHTWGKRQKFNKESSKWEGEFELSLFCGKKTLHVSYKEILDRYQCYKSDFDDPTLLYHMFKELADLTQSTISDIFHRMEAGKWVIDEKKEVITFVHSDVGVLIARDNKAKFLDFGESNLKLNFSECSLLDYSNRRIMSCQTGLLNCSHLPTFDFKSDFSINGVTLEDMIKLGVLSHNFDIQYKTKKEVLSVLNDIEMPKPNVTSLTISKLKLPGKWEICERNVDTKSNLEVDLDKKMGFEEYKNTMMDVDMTGFTLDDSPELDGMEEFTLAELNQAFFVSTSTTTIMTFPRQILNNVIHFKENAICHQLLKSMKISPQTLDIIMATLKTHRREIYYALVSYYDQMYHTDQGTPPIMQIDFNLEFFSKFDVEIYDSRDYLKDLD